MPDDTDARVIAQYTTQPGGRSRAAVRHDDHACMDAVSHAHAPSMMEADPAGAACGV